MARGKKGIKQGLKKSDQTVSWCKKIIEKVQEKDCGCRDLQKELGIKEPLFPSILLQLTYMAPIYDYKIGSKQMLGMIRKEK